MKLKEFELDCPYVRDEKFIYQLLKQGYDYENAVKFDYKQNFQTKRIAFRNQTRCITSMVERLCGEIITDDYWKITVNCIKAARD